MNDDVEMENAEENFEKVIGSGWRRTIAKLMAFKGMKIRRLITLGKTSGQPMEHIFPTNKRRSLMEKTLQDIN